MNRSSRNLSYSSNSYSEILADTNKAEVHKENFVLKNPNGEGFSWINSTPEDLGAGGIGLEMYLVYLKQMTIFFGILSVISLPAMILNYMGGCLNEVEKTSPFESSTLANQKEIPADIEYRDNPQNIISQNKTNMYITVSIDFVYSIVYIILSYLIECYNNKRISQTKNVSVSDFSIMIRLKEGINATEEELRGFFEKYGPIHECYIAKYYGNSLKQYIKFTNTTNDLYKEMKNSTGIEDSKKIDDIKARRYELLDDIRNEPEHEEDSIKAFIIFESIKSRNDCLNTYNTQRIKGKLQNQDQRLKFKNTPVLVKTPPEPSGIYWNNLGIRRSKWKTIIIYLVIF